MRPELKDTESISRGYGSECWGKLAKLQAPDGADVLAELARLVRKARKETLARVSDDSSRHHFHAKYDSLEQEVEYLQYELGRWQ